MPEKYRILQFLNDVIENNTKNNNVLNVNINCLLPEQKLTEDSMPGCSSNKIKIIAKS